MSKLSLLPSRNSCMHAVERVHCTTLWSQAAHVGVPIAFTSPNVARAQHNDHGHVGLCVVTAHAAARTLQALNAAVSHAIAAL
jgi:hypothetical protein